VYEQQFHMEV